jgi:DNA modification methylase
MTFRIIVGDCREAIPDDLQADAVVTDPPYHLVTMTKRFGAEGAARPKSATYARMSKGFMGQEWDGGNVAFQVETWQAIRAHMKPGAHLIAFGGSRTFHRLVCAVEDAGFEIRDTLQWLYGSGFPKSHDIAKDIDRIHGVQGDLLDTKTWVQGGGNALELRRGERREAVQEIRALASDDAKRWEGWGTALCPAFEPILLARNPLSESSIARNVLKHGTGAINIDATRIPGLLEGDPQRFAKTDGGSFVSFPDRPPTADRPGRRPLAEGRWPKNVLLDPVIANTLDDWQPGAARMFYVAKPDAKERGDRSHPTIKPVDLMSYLIRLICPPGGTVLDPFMGSGTTGMAATCEDRWNFVGVELSPAYADQARRSILSFSPMFAKEAV